MEQEECVWFKQGFCKLNRCIDNACDLHDLEFTKQAISDRVKEEIAFITLHKGDKEFKDISQDKMMGLKVLAKALRKAKRLRYDKKRPK